MPSENKEQDDGLQRHLSDAPPPQPGPEPAEPPAVPADDAEEEAVEAEEPATVSEKKERRIWPLALVLTLAVLAGGGFYTLTGMRNTAHKLGGGSEYDKLAANSSVYEGESRRYRDLDVFAGGGEEPLSAAAQAAGGGRVNPALFRTKDELLADARGGGQGGGAAAAQPGAEEPQAEPGAQGAAPAPQQGAAMARKLQAKGFLSSGPGGSRSKGGAPGSAAGFEGSGTLVGRASVQRETRQGAPRQAGKASVMDSLKGSFKASLYGARVASQDAAKSWVARAFDASPEASTAIEYDEKMRSKLDRVNPNSIPQFLRDQDLSADGARSMGDMKVSKPKMDKDATYDSLKEDSDYQKKKMASDFAGSMINGLFAGVSGTGNEGGEAPGDSRSEPPSAEVYADPEDVAELGPLALGEYMQTEGYGGECGCTPDAPCCCLPQDYFGSQAAQQNACPMYGPFLPDDPCGQSFQTDGAVSAGDTFVTPFSGPQ